eukprot:gene33324-44606_t
MRGVVGCASGRERGWLSVVVGPLLGGLVVGLLALVTPEVLSSGHGALHVSGGLAVPLTVIATVFALKTVASVISLGSGFRGGLFFASLLLGALGGHLFAAGASALLPNLNLDSSVYAVIGMSALSASVIGGPLTMTFIALEATGNLWLTTAVLIAVIVATQTTRELFGYSFATWRLHLRGETIRSAADVGWIRDLTVAGMMRADMVTVNAGISIAAFRAQFPLGSKNQVIAVDGNGRYAGIALVAEAHETERKPEASIQSILRNRSATLVPEMNVQQAVAAFDGAEAESLAVVDTRDRGRVIGVLTEAFALRRYAEESEKRRRAAGAGGGAHAGYQDLGRSWRLCKADPRRPRHGGAWIALWMAISANGAHLDSTHPIAKSNGENVMSGNSNKIAWVTGGGTGIGKAGAEALLADGWTVIISGRRAEMLKAVTDELGAGGKPIEAMALDVSKSADVTK